MCTGGYRSLGTCRRALLQHAGTRRRPPVGRNEANAERPSTCTEALFYNPFTKKLVVGQNRLRSQTSTIEHLGFHIGVCRFASTTLSSRGTAFDSRCAICSHVRRTEDGAHIFLEPLLEATMSEEFKIACGAFKFRRVSLSATNHLSNPPWPFDNCFSYNINVLTRPDTSTMCIASRRRSHECSCKKNFGVTRTPNARTGRFTNAQQLPPTNRRAHGPRLLTQRSSNGHFTDLTTLAKIIDTISTDLNTDLDAFHKTRSPSLTRPCSAPSDHGHVPLNHDCTKLRNIVFAVPHRTFTLPRFLRYSPTIHRKKKKALLILFQRAMTTQLRSLETLVDLMFKDVKISLQTHGSACHLTPT